jgi:hypothetical protein
VCCLKNVLFFAQILFYAKSGDAVAAAEVATVASAQANVIASWDSSVAAASVGVIKGMNDVRNKRV